MASSVESPNLANEEHPLEQQLAVGAIAFLDVNPMSGAPVRCRTAIRGWNTGRSVFIDKPSPQSGIVLRHNQSCALRFIRDGIVWGFLSNILDQVPDRAERVLRLGWPMECSHLHLRRFERVRVSIPGVIEFRDGSTCQATIRDISSGGCALVTDTPLAHGSCFTMSFTLPDGLAVENIGTDVRNVRPLSGAECLYGCQFSDIQEYERSGIGLYVVKALTLDRNTEPTPARVLLLSSMSGDAEMIRAAAKGAGYEIVQASSVVDLFFQLRAFPPRALLIHARQVELAAAEICRVVKQASGFERLPVIIYGNEAALIRDAAIAAGASLYMEELTDSPIIRALLSQSAERRVSTNKLPGEEQEPVFQPSLVSA